MLWLMPLQFEQRRSNGWRRALSCGMFSAVRISGFRTGARAVPCGMFSAVRVFGSVTGANAVLGIFGMIRTLSVIRFRGSGTELGLVMSLLGINLDAITSCFS